MKIKAFAVLCCFIIANSSVANISADAEERRPPVKIGLMTELSGSFASIGDECQRGWTIARESKLPTLKNVVDIVSEDHQRSPKLALSAFRRMIDEQGVIGLAFTASPVGLALNPISQDRGIPILGSVAHPKYITGNSSAFRLWTTVAAEGKILAEYATALKLKRFAVLTLEDDYPLAVSNAFVEAAKASGIEVVINERILNTESSYATIAAKIRAAKPDAIFVNVIGDQVPGILRRFRELRLTQKIFTSYSLGNTEIRVAAGAAAENASFLEIDGDKPWLLSEMKQRYGADSVNSLNYSCFLSLWMLLSAFEKNPAIQTASDLQTTLLGISNLTTPDGNVEIRDREAQLGMLMRTVKAGALETMRDIR